MVRGSERFRTWIAESGVTAVKASIVNGVMYAFVVAAAVSASAVVFLVALEVREGMGVAAFVGSLVVFPVTWLVGPLVLAAGGDTAYMPAFVFSLAVAAPPVLATLLARRSTRRQAEERRLDGLPPRDMRPALGPHAMASGAMPIARPYPLAPPPNVPGSGPMTPVASSMLRRPSSADDSMPLHPVVYGPQMPAPIAPPVAG